VPGTPNYILNKRFKRMKPKRKGIMKMVFLLSISPSTTQKGYRQVSPSTRHFAIRIMRRLRNPLHTHQQHASVASSSDGNDRGLTWVVDSGASRHFSAVASDFTSLKLDDQMGTVSGIDCKIEGSGGISFYVHGKDGKPVHMILNNVLYVPSLENRSGGSYLRLTSVRLVVHH
jgi:hypothetical protein